MLFECIRTHNADQVALREGDDRVTYGDLSDLIDARCLELADVDVLGIALDNGIDWLVWDLAALSAGIVCVPIPPFFTRDQINHTIVTAGITHMLTANGMAETGQSRSPDIPDGTAKITFTSGTTGTPKGVCLPASAMITVASSIHAMLGDDFAGTHACVLPLAVLLENVAGFMPVFWPGVPLP